MKSLIAIVLLSGAPMLASAAKPCGELKAEITRKLDAKGIQFYSLEIVPDEKVTDPGKVIGSCDGGKAKILYSRTPATNSKPKDTAHPSAKNKQ